MFFSASIDSTGSNFGTVAQYAAKDLCNVTVSVPLSVRLSRRNSGGAAMTQRGRRQTGCGSTGPQHSAQQHMRAVPCLQPS